MDYNLDCNESGSPFLASPFSPTTFHSDNEQMTSPLLHGLEMYPESSQTWHDEFRVDIVHDAYAHNDILYSKEVYTLTSLDQMSPTTNFDLGTLCEIPCTSQAASNEANESVTSRLKSVLISRKKLQGQSFCSSNSSLEPVCSINTNSVEPFSGNSITGNFYHEQVNEVRERKFSTSSTLRFPPCFVCGGTASGLHYGVNSCEPCKGFFTRYLRKKEEYKCGRAGNCPITNRLRGNCSACRLKKCLTLGMSRKNSRLGRYSLSRRMETIMQVTQLEKKNIKQTELQQNPVFNTTCESEYLTGDDDSDSLDDSSTKGYRPSTTLPTKIAHRLGTCKVKASSGFSHKLVNVLVEYMKQIKPYGDNLERQDQIEEKLRAHYESYKLKIKLFGNLKTIPKDEYFNLLNQFGIEIDKRMMFLKESANEIMDVIERYCNFAKQVPNFKSLSCRDQSNLLKSSRYDFFMILMHEGYLHEEQVFLAHNGVAFHREEVADKFFSRQLVLTVCDMYHRLQKLKLSTEEKALLIAISLVFTDRCTLENPKLVEQIQFSLVHLLQRQLEKTCKNSASRRFTKIIDCMTIMRESSELYLQEYNQLCKDENVIEEVPIMTELLFEDK